MKKNYIQRVNMPVPQELPQDVKDIIVKLVYRLRDEVVGCADPSDRLIKLYEAIDDFLIEDFASRVNW